MSTPSLDEVIASGAWPLVVVAVHNNAVAKDAAVAAGALELLLIALGGACAGPCTHGEGCQELTEAVRAVKAICFKCVSARERAAELSLASALVSALQRAVAGVEGSGSASEASARARVVEEVVVTLSALVNAGETHREQAVGAGGVAAAARASAAVATVEGATSLGGKLKMLGALLA